MVGPAAGGAYDAFTRVLVKHWGRLIPGNPTFVVENMPGGGGLLSATHGFSTGKLRNENSTEVVKSCFPRTS